MANVQQTKPTAPKSICWPTPNPKSPQKAGAATWKPNEFALTAADKQPGPTMAVATSEEASLDYRSVWLMTLYTPCFLLIQESAGGGMYGKMHTTSFSFGNILYVQVSTMFASI